ncbi:zingipain-2 [Trifolium medium]|uniref:Zingipain-2 n=1 Tax=Trifolium medium TaxID=97028 RepID=A0A392RLR6_9FABA|nr:zingipain-2 [Trifolium medium]
MSTIDDQGSCDSYWAHVATSAVEFKVKLETEKLEKLSSQELIDYDSAWNGRQGGWVEKVFDYIRKEGLSLDKDYPQSYFNTPLFHMPYRLAFNRLEQLFEIF